MWKELGLGLQKRTAVQAASIKFVWTVAWKQTSGLAGLATLRKVHTCFMQLFGHWIEEVDSQWAVISFSSQDVGRECAGLEGWQFKQPGQLTWGLAMQKPKWSQLTSLTPLSYDSSGLANEVWAKPLQVPHPRCRHQQGEGHSHLSTQRLDIT